MLRHSVLQRSCARRVAVPSNQSIRRAAKHWRHVCQAGEDGNNQNPGGLDDERLLAGLISVGLSGSLAVGGAKLAGIDLWRMFRWGQDIETALTYAAPVLLLELFLLGVPWDLTLKPAQQASSSGEQSSKSWLPTAADRASRSASRSAAAAEAEAGTSSISQRSASRAAVVTESSDDIKRSIEQQQASSTETSSSSRSTETGSSSSNSRSTEGSSQGQNDSVNGNASSQLGVSRSPFNLALSPDVLDGQFSWPQLQAMLALQQAVYIAGQTMLKADIPLAADAGLIVFRESAKELLQRGLFVTFVAGWLADRAFEAGVDDSITLLAPLGPVYLTDFCRWLVAILAALFMVPPVLADVKALALSVATNMGVLLVQSSEDKDEGSSKTDQLLLEYRLYDMMQKTLDSWPVRASQAVHTVRGILRFLAINAAFAATQNLAASLLVSLASNQLLLLYSTAGRARLRLSPKPQSRGNDAGPGGKGRREKRPPTLRWPPDQK